MQPDSVSLASLRTEQGVANGESVFHSPQVFAGQQQYTLSVEPLSFAHLQGVGIADLLRPTSEVYANHPRDARVLRSLVALAMREWNRTAHELGYDRHESADSLIQLFTRKSAITVPLMLSSAKGASADEERGRIEGCVVVLTDEADFHDRDSLPVQWLAAQTGESEERIRSRVVRGVRAFMSPFARRYGAPGEGLHKMIDAAMEALGPETLILSRTAKGNPAALKRFTAWGFEATGQYTHEEGRDYEWLVYPPLTDDGRIAQVSRQRKLLSLQAHEQQRIAFPLAHFSLQDSMLLVSGYYAQEDGRALAGACPHSLVAVAVADAGARLTRAERQVANLRAVQTEASLAELVFSEGAERFHGVFLSGAFPETGPERRTELLRNAAHALRYGGKLVIRDMVIPAGPEVVEFVVKADDGANDGPPRARSTASLYETYGSHMGVLRRVYDAASGSCTHVVFRTTLFDAAEFMHKEQYRDDFLREQNKTYLQLDEEAFIAIASEHNLRLITVEHENNPFVQERRAARFSLRDVNGRVLPLPPTGIRFVAQKVRPDEAVSIAAIETQPKQTPTFCRFQFWQRCDAPQEVWEVVERPGDTVRVLPYSGSMVALLERPRPLITLMKRCSGFTLEAMAGIVDGRARSEGGENFGKELRDYLGGSSSSAFLSHVRTTVRNTVQRFTGLKEEECSSDAVGALHHHWSSPGALSELVLNAAVQVPHFREASLPSHTFGLPTGGRIRFHDARQVLAAAQHGGLGDCELERMLYTFLQSQGLIPYPWAGGGVSLVPQRGSFPTNELSTFRVAPRAVFEPCATVGGEPCQRTFLELCETSFKEVLHHSEKSGADAAAESPPDITLEHVRPHRQSRRMIHTLLVVPLVRDETEKMVWVGFEERDLPVVQIKSGQSGLRVLPAFRAHVGLDVYDDEGLKHYLTGELPNRHGIELRRMLRLGGEYFASPAVLEEVVHPVLVEVEAASINNSDLQFFPLRDLVGNSEVVEGHSLTGLYRSWHAIGGYSGVLFDE